MNNTEKTPVGGRIALRLFLYVLAILISIPLSTWSYLMLFFPLISTIIALIFVIKIFIDGRREYRKQNKRVGNAYFITAGIIVLLQTGVVLWYWLALDSALSNWH